MEYVYGRLSNHDGEYPLDYAAMQENAMEFYIIATDAETGEPHYFFKNDLSQDHYEPFMASSIPFVCRPYPINGKLYFDGALGDPVPVQKAFDLGCDKVVLILTKPADNFCSCHPKIPLVWILFTRIRNPCTSCIDRGCATARRSKLF